MDVCVEDLMGALDALPDVRAAIIAAELRAALEKGPSGTMRRWFEERNGQRVDTIQFDMVGGGLWTPLLREIDASRSSFVRLDGSYREYAGMRVVARSDTALIVHNDWHVIGYVLSDAAEGRAR